MIAKKKKPAPAKKSKGKAGAGRRRSGNGVVANVSRMVTQPEGQQPIEPVAGVAATYPPWPVQTSASNVPLSRRLPGPDEPPPALPDMIPDPEPQLSFLDETTALALARRPDLLRAISSHDSRRLRGGCYLIRYTPLQASPILNSLHYDGTMRVERNGGNTTASGDLYIHRLSFPTPGSSFPLPRPVEPNPADGIPVFARSSYSYYLRVTQILEGTNSGNFRMSFEFHRFTASTNSFALEETYTALMSWTTAPSGYPAGGDYLTGEVKKNSGAVVGTLTMGWVSEYLRRAFIEIDTVPDSERPISSGNGVDWRKVFDQVNWDVTVIESDVDVVGVNGDTWSDAEMHATMLERRGRVSLDTEWRYHILCVRFIDSTPRGIMYDNGATDSNNVPREGVGIATHWMIPNSNTWGLVKGKRFGLAEAPFFRTALHEIGHAMGLYHNTVDMGVMNTTDVIAANATPPVQFPNNIQWSHAPDDQKRLRHMPDMWVRPGGIPFGHSYSASPISLDDTIQDAQGLDLHVAPVMTTFPIGAPVRVNFAIRNTLEYPVPAPRSLSIKTGFVKGKVIDPSGTVRAFLPIIRCLEEHELALLEPGQVVGNSLTLLRGPQGALFPAPGCYRIMVEVDYDIGGVTMGLTGETSVMVTSAKTLTHADAALKVLSTPDTVLVLAIGGDHLDEGRAAIQAALQDEVLRPHYAVMEARRVGTRFRGRKGDLDAASQLIDETSVFSPAEIRKVAQMVEKDDNAKGPGKRSLANMLAIKASDLGASDEIVDMVKKL